MNERTLTVGEAVEEIGVGPFQYKLLAICGASWAADAMEVIIIAYVIPIVVRQWSLTSAQAGLIGTAIFVGMLGGAWFWGTITDYVGRKLGFQLTVLVDSVFGFLSALSPSYVWLLLLRAITGFGVGGTLPVDYAVFSEYLPKRNRGRYLVLLESFWAVGTIVVAGLAWLILPAAPNVGWRILLAVSALPGALVFFIRRHIPESPRYLLIEGREEEARRVLQQVARENGKTLNIDRLEVQERTERITLAALWKKRYARTTLMLWVGWFCISLGYYGVFIWLPGIFVERGFAFLRTYQNTFLLALAQLPGYFSAAYLVERWGRKWTLAVYLLFSGLFTYLFAVVSGLPFIVGSAMLMSFFTLGAWGVLYAYTPELYPTEVRATGMGWASGMTRIAGAIAPILGGWLISVSLVVALTLYAISFVIGGVTVFLLGRETKGRPLLETVEG
ncbi:MAG: MFS transporter [Anaerolineae bacterium]|jgi:putative MFS transporter